VKADDILYEARDTIIDREGIYQSPALNHLRIAKLWSAYLERHIEPHQVAVCMALVKIARTINSADHRDSYVDGAAYLAIAGQIGSIDWDDLDSY
jgi:hypothetical protein